MSNYTYISNVGIILGIIVIMTCLFGDIPNPHKFLILIIMPIIVIVNYYSLMEIECYKNKTVNSEY